MTEDLAVIAAGDCDQTHELTNGSGAVVGAEIVAFRLHRVEPTRATLTSFLGDVHDQRMTDRSVEIHELFIDQTALAVS